jgi:CHAD domain-containing protein
MKSKGMSMARMDKRIPAVSPDDRTSDVAGRTLRFRLAAVQHYLPLAAEKPDEDIEYVHELRVATRRTMAALQLYADMLPRRRTARMKTRLKQIRRAAGDARDYDVLAQRLAKERPGPEANRLLEDVRGQRRKAQKPILALHRRLEREDRFERRIAKLLRGIRPRGKKKTLEKNPRFGDWATASLRPLIKRFFKAARTIEKDTEVLHQFRIRGKKLRYAMELLAGAFPPAFREKLYPVIEDLQAKLGEINDHVTEQARLRQRIEADEAAAEVDYLENLFTQENDHIEHARQELLSWWTPKLQESLRAGFDKLLAARPEPEIIGRPNPPRRKRSRH